MPDVKNDVSRFLIENGKPGRLVKIIDRKQLKTRKEFSNHVVQKVTRRVVRLGASYQNVQRKHNDPSFVSKELPYGEWIKYPYVIGHKGTEHIRCMIATNAFRSQSEYFLDGEEVNKETVRHMCLKSEFSSRPLDEYPLVFNLKADNIEEVKAGNKRWKKQ